MTGPLPTIYYHPRSKLEARCHRCPWADFQWTEAEARSRLLRHLDTAHINPPPPMALRRDQMPGR